MINQIHRANQSAQTTPSVDKILVSHEDKFTAEERHHMYDQELDDIDCANIDFDDNYDDFSHFVHSGFSSRMNATNV